MKNSIWLLAISILSVSATVAQTTAPPLSYGPGQKIVLTATFEGAGADQLTTGGFCFRLQGDISPSQPGFDSQLCSNGNDSKLIPPHAIEMTFTVPKNQAAGIYHLHQISADVRSLNIGFVYDSTEVPNRMVKIDNPNTSAKPKLKDVQVH